MNPVAVYSHMHNAVGGLLHLQYFYCTEYLPLSPRGIRCYAIKEKQTLHNHTSLAWTIALPYILYRTSVTSYLTNVRSKLEKKKDRNFDAHGANALEHVLIQGLRVQNDSLHQQLSRCGQ